jgi:peroxiredoxin
MNRRELVAGLLMSVSSAAAQAHSDTGEASRRTTPPLEIATTDGKSVRVHQQKGKVILIDFMTTVCPTCKVASAGIQKLYQELGSKGFFPIAVALDVGAPFMLFGYKHQFGLTFPVGVASREVVTGYLQHSPSKPLMVPTLVLLDRRGRIVSTSVGWQSEGDLRASLLKLLAE